jgi:hypothetical protein
MKPAKDKFKGVEYSALGEEPTNTYRKHWSILSFGTGCATTVIIGAILLSAYWSLSVPTPETKTAAELEAAEWNYCGRSSKTAMARGCVMEPLFYGWMPPQCVYRNLSDTLPVFEDRTYWSDMNRTNVVTPEDLWAGKHILVYADM